MWVFFSERFSPRCLMLFCCLGCSSYLEKDIFLCLRSTQIDLSKAGINICVVFLEEQGYKILSKMLHQHNQSAIKMAKNSRNSCTSNSILMVTFGIFDIDNLCSNNIYFYYLLKIHLCIFNFIFSAMSNFKITNSLNHFVNKKLSN